MGNDMPKAHPTYEEKLTSLRTEVLFIALAILFLGLLIWRVMADGFGVIAAGFLFMLLLFIFYSLNYRILVIRVLAGKLVLKFGVFSWAVPISTIETVYEDKTSLWRIGGAGIHFLIVHGRYRAMFNFLQHGRIVIRFVEKRGLVKEVAFSTGKPEYLMHLLMAGK